MRFPSLHRRLPIRFQVLSVLVALATVTCAVAVSTLISFFNEDKATYIQDLNADIASNTAASVDLLLQFYQERLARVAEAFNSADDPGQTLKQFFERNDDLIYLAVYDEQGSNVLSLCQEKTVADAHVDPADFRAQRIRVGMSPAYVRMEGMVVGNSTAAPGLLTFSMRLPFYAASYGRVFLVRADLSATHLVRAIQRTPGFTTYVVDKRGAVLVHPDPSVMASQQSFVDRKVVQALLANLGRTAAGTGEFTDPGGETTLGSYASIRSAGLGVIVERPKKDAYLAADRLSRRSVRAVALIVVIAALFSVLISRAITAPLLELSLAARRLEKGDFDTHVEPRGNDELGDLARSFNLAAAGLKERDLKLKDTYEQLLQSEKLAGFGKFSAGIAHEIKNPLTGIIGFAQIMSRKLPDGDPKKSPLQMIEREAKRCKSILDNLLKFTRKEGFQFGPLRLHAHLRDTLDLVAPQLGINQVQTAVELNAPDDLIRGDANQLQQVFMNLILNSIDAMEGQGERKIGIATRAGDEGFIEILLSDNGSGIPEDKIRKIFDPFFTTKEPGKGTGLGLSVSYGIVTNHGGRISARSAVGEGTEFKIVLPIAASDVRSEERRLEAKKSTSGAHAAVAAAPAAEPGTAVAQV